jgi:hypothetical protein
VLKVLFVVAIFAIVTYGLVRVIERRGVAPRGRGPVNRGPRPKPRPLGPDDDPDFLRNLERKRKRPKDPEGPTG